MAFRAIWDICTSMSAAQGQLLSVKPHLSCKFSARACVCARMCDSLAETSQRANESAELSLTSRTAATRSRLPRLRPSRATATTAPGWLSVCYSYIPDEALSLRSGVHESRSPAPTQSFQGCTVAVPPLVAPFSPAVQSAFLPPHPAVLKTVPRTQHHRFESRFETFSGAAPPLTTQYPQKCAASLALYGG